MSDEFVRRFVLSCVLAAAPTLALAQAKPPAKARAEEPLGRLFFTPAQRASLDIARTRRARTTVANEGNEETATPVAQSVTYSGMVRRSDGKSTFFVNNRAFNENEAAVGPVVGRVRPDGRITLQLPQSGRSVDLKPGQSIELLSGTIEDGFARKPAAPEPKPAAKSDAGGKPTGKTASAERSVEERNREEREQQRVDEAVARALQEAAAKPGPAPAPERPR